MQGITNLLRKIMPRSLFGRALVILVTPMVLVQIVAGFVFYDRVWDTVSRRLSNAIAGEVATVVQTMSRYPAEEDRRWLVGTMQLAYGSTYTFEPGAILDRTGPAQPDTILEHYLVAGLNERVRRPFLLDAWGDPDDIRLSVQLPDGVLHLVTSRQRVFTTNVYVFVLFMVGSSLILIAIASAFMNNQVRPIKRLAAAAEAFGKGREDAEFRAYGASEVRQAASAFLTMRERIRRYMAQRTEMLAGISHDLRTPLTRMKLELAMLGDHQSAAGLKTDVGDMERMVESYLAFVRGEGEEKIVESDLGAILGDIVSAMLRGGNSVTLELVGDMHIALRPHAVKRSVENLVANAVRHAAQVRIRAERHAGDIEIVIDDDGPGIPAESREDVFKPFFRLDAARNAETGGVGLGMTIARDVIRGHGGDVRIDESPMGGARARIRLPL
ncbi:MAG: HAMP domain-containing protein [Rhodospirillales bacterium]|nr:HAMP domain-containing protein [Rhodospirillales bacterium]